jgi:hypothetical protein
MRRAIAEPLDDVEQALKQGLGSCGLARHAVHLPGEKRRE